MRREGLAGHISGHARSAATRAKAVELGLVDCDSRDGRRGGARCRSGHPVRRRSAPVAKSPARSGRILKPGAILTDVGSVKGAVVRDVGPHVPKGVHFIPGHPIAGTEQSGPTPALPNCSTIAGAS